MYIGGCFYTAGDSFKSINGLVLGIGLESRKGYFGIEHFIYYYYRVQVVNVTKSTE